MTALVGFAIGLVCGAGLGALAIVLIEAREQKWRDQGRNVDG